jgi:flagellar biosynthesis/type III secretory pathway M-ring protein FliF/YscJ
MDSEYRSQIEALVREADASAAEIGPRRQGWQAPEHPEQTRSGEQAQVAEPQQQDAHIHELITERLEQFAELLGEETAEVIKPLLKRLDALEQSMKRAAT